MGRTKRPMLGCIEWGCPILPSNPIPPRALPARFRRSRVLIVGCGDVGQRLAHAVQAQAGTTQRHGPRLLALTSSPEKMPQLRAAGVLPLLGNLDDLRTLRRLAGVAQRVLHLAPPPGSGTRDTRTAHLLRALGLGRAPQSLVYGSTTGVYGDCGGAWVNEVWPVAPATPRGVRRADAQQQWRAYGLRSGARVNVLRIPGIYAPDREGGTPRGRLLKGLPVLLPGDDVFTNHIHADDLARIAWAALWRGQPQRTYHASDDTELHMGDYFDLAADLYGLPRPPRLSRQEAQKTLPAVMLSFMSESRRLRNDRIKQELRVQLRYPTVREGLRS